MVKPTLDERAKLVEVLGDEDRVKVESGELTIWFPGKEGAYPVLRWAKDNSQGKQAGALAPGTGHAEGAGQIGEIQARYAYRKSNAYREVLEMAIPAELDPEIRGSLGWIMEQAMNAVEGGQIYVDATCPQEDCGHKFKVKAWKKPDAMALKILIEQVLGAAVKTENVNVEQRVLIEALNERFDVTTIETYALPDEIIERRRREIEAIDDEGTAPETVEGTWVSSE